MNYREEYASKLTTAAQAVSVVKDGDWIDYGWCTGHPVALDQALAERMPQLTDIKVRGGVALWAPAIFKIDNPQDHFCWNSWHMDTLILAPVHPIWLICAAQPSTSSWK